MLPIEAPKEAGKGFAKSMLKWLNSIRACLISWRIVSIDVREAWDIDERIGSVIKPTKSGTLVNIVVPAGLPAFPDDDGEYLLWVKITDGEVDPDVDPNPTWFGPPSESGTQVLGSIDGEITWIDTDTC